MEVDKTIDEAIRCQHAWLRCGLFLRKIMESGRWRETHKNFAQYCIDHWPQFAKYSRGYIYKLIRQADAVSDRTLALPLIRSGDAAEEFGKLDSDTKAAVIDALADKEIITAPMVKAAAENVAESIEPKPALKPCDSLGQVLPKNLISVFSRLPELKELHAEAERLRHKIQAKVDSEDDLYRHIRMQLLDTDLRNVKAVIRFAYPYAICPYCKGSKCEKCGGGGWMPKDIIELVPEEDRSS